MNRLTITFVIFTLVGALAGVIGKAALSPVLSVQLFQFFLACAGVGAFGVVAALDRRAAKREAAES